MLKLVKYHPLFAYSVGDVFEVNEKDTETLIKGGFAIEATEDDILGVEIEKEKKEKEPKKGSKK